MTTLMPFFLGNPYLCVLLPVSVLAMSVCYPCLLIFELVCVNLCRLLYEDKE